MKSSKKTEVLVVGAGPVGMFTALRLAQCGVHVNIIDQESRTAGHSYACALHPSSIDLLDEAGVAVEAIELGLRIGRIGYYQGSNRELVLNLGELELEFPFILALPQSAFEDLLEDRLRQLPNVKFHWHHRLQDLQMDGEGVTATIEKLGFTGQGYGTPEIELSVAKETRMRADYLIGADGHASMVRRRLGIEPQRTGQPELFMVYEFETDTALEPELKVVLDETTTSVMWPLGGNRCRWSFQLVPARPPGDFSGKDRLRMTIEDEAGPDSRQAHLEKLLCERAPWFLPRVTNLLWSMDIQFEHWSAAQFQQGRCFLAGDAAHQTGPVGMRSMNLGLKEGDDLARKLTRVMQGVHAETLATYDAEDRGAWEKLPGIARNAKPADSATAWIKKNCARIIATLPLSGKDIGNLLGGAGIELK